MRPRILKFLWEDKKIIGTSFLEHFTKIFLETFLNNSINVKQKKFLEQKKKKLRSIGDTFFI